MIPDQTDDSSDSLVIQTEPGLSITLGNTAQAAATYGALLDDRDIARFGSVLGDAPANADDESEHFDGIFDFNILGVIAGESANIVLPLRSGIPRNASYRKFNPATGWAAFAEDENNVLASTTVAGACPAPGSSDYQPGLNYLDNCVQLTIEDGGPNDADGEVNAMIADPGTIGLQLTEPEENEVREGGGLFPIHLLLGLFCLAGLIAIKKRT